MSFSLDDIPPSEQRKPTGDIARLVAEPGCAPREDQSPAPADYFNPRRDPVERSPELDRILKLEWRAPYEEGTAEAEALIDLMTERFRKPDGPCKCAELGEPCILRLRLPQAAVLYEAPQASGKFGMIGVGHGKTLLDILVALSMRVKVAVLLVPAGLVKQLIDNYKLIEQHWHTPRMIVHGRGETDRQFQGSRPDVLLHVLSYDRLSRPENTVWLVDTRPDLIIADECDKLGDLSAARTDRFMRYLRKYRPKFCGWTGTPTSTDLTDYYHLIGAALNDTSPVPRDEETATDWSRALIDDDPCDPGALLSLCDPNIVDQEGNGEHVQAAFHRRLVGTLGVTHTTTSSHDAPIDFERAQGIDVPLEIQLHLDTLRDAWIRPDGWPYENALEASACACQLACGFYYRWRYPRGEKQSLIDEWLAKRKAWCGELRWTLKTKRREHMDSEKLLKLAAMRAWGDIPNDERLPEWKAQAWPDWRDIQNQVQPKPEPVLLDPFVARWAAEWAAKNRGIIWYTSTAFGRWIADFAGLPLYGGKGTKRLVDSKSRIIEDGSRSAILSLESHGRGRNGLQFVFADQLVAQPPSNPTRWEQMLGRLSRPGQKADRVRCVVMDHTDELQAHIYQAISRARYVRGTLGQHQRILEGLGRPRPAE